MFSGYLGYQAGSALRFSQPTLGPIGVLGIALGVALGIALDTALDIVLGIEVWQTSGPSRKARYVLPSESPISVEFKL